MYYVDASCNFTGERTSDPSHATATKVQIYIIDKKNIYIHLFAFSKRHTTNNCEMSQGDSMPKPSIYFGVFFSSFCCHSFLSLTEEVKKHKQRNGQVCLRTFLESNRRTSSFTIISS